MTSPDEKSPAKAAGTPNGSAINPAARTNSSGSGSAPPPGQSLTGKQEHYLKRELISQQVKDEISELNSPTALRRFGAPFKSDFGEVSPLESELPILRYIFVHHIRDFPFLDKAREKEFWQDKLQVFLESFASKSISSSEDRLEETKRRKLALKCQKLVELMMVSGVRTSSGFEERIRFSEIEFVDSHAIDTGVMNTIPEGNYFNGWDINVAGVRIVKERKSITSHRHAEFILRVKRIGELEHFVTRRYSDFRELHKSVRHELPGKVLPSLPKKNKANSTVSGFLSPNGDIDSEASSVSSSSTQLTGLSAPGTTNGPSDASSMNLAVRGHRRGSSVASGRASPRVSTDGRPKSPYLKTPTQDRITLVRETQRISLRAFLRSLLQSPQIAATKSIESFLTKNPITPRDEDVEDIEQRKHIDENRIEEQKQFYEIARKRAAELDVYMEQFRQDIVERNGLTMLFQEIKDKKTIEDLSIQYRKFAEWLRIEVAATIYHLFLAEDNSPELFQQLKNVHRLVPYTPIKLAIRYTNPAAVMSTILDLLLKRFPGTSTSTMQAIFSVTLNEGIKTFQRAINDLASKIGDDVIVEKLQAYTDAPDDVKAQIRKEASSMGFDLVIGILQSDDIGPELEPHQTELAFNAYVAFNNAVENIDVELRQGAQLFSYMKQLLKLCTRKRDKTMMLRLIEEPVTLQLFKDVFTIFYEPLVRVYRSANVHNSVTDFSVFIDDMIKVVHKCQEQDASADPNQTVQAFIDLCQRHEHNFYKFVHEVHTHDNGLFTQLMGWIENILEFLRHGPTSGSLDINALFEGGVAAGLVDKSKAIEEVDKLIAWQEARKKWHHDKTRQKMAAEGSGVDVLGGALSLTASDFGLDQGDLDDMAYDDEGSETESEAEEEDELDPIEAERRRRAKKRDRLRRSAGEPVKPHVSEVHKLRDNFMAMLREVLAE